MTQDSRDKLRSAGATAAPTVSIGLPVFNGAAYLAETIEAILAQTYPDFELILCDNASTDGTDEICRDYAERDSRIRYHRQPRNIGACGNYDMAFHMSRGRFFKWAAHDDLLAPAYLEHLVAVLEEDAGCVLVHPRTVRIDAEGREKGDYIDEIACDSDSPAERLERWLCPTKALCNPVFGLMRRDAMAKTPLHGDYIASDRVFLAAMTLQGRCRAIPERLFLRRLHPGNSTTAHPNKRDLAAWFKGTPPKLPVFPIWRLFFGHLNAIRSTALPLGERLRCYRVITKWMKEERKRLFSELLLPLYFDGHPTRFGRIAYRTLKR